MRIVQEGLTFDDVLLLPGHSRVLPKDVTLSTSFLGFDLPIPLVSSAMDTVTESRLAIALAQEGGVGVLHKNMSIEDQVAEVRHVKKYESGIVQDPVTVTPDTRIEHVLALAKKYNFSGMPVVKGDALVGIITNRDVRFTTDTSQPVSNLMTPRDRLVTVKEGTSRQAVMDLLHQHRIEKVLVVDDAFQLKGMITVKDMLKSAAKPHACKDASGQLRVAAAVGVGKKAQARVGALVESGVDFLVVDTAHGHSQGVIDTVVWIKSHFPDMPLVAGNIATAEAAQALITAGADGLKVGIGPGSICTTRIIAGVGVPQMTAISNVAEVAKRYQVPVIADGGIRFSGDICKALVAGASVVMIGSLLAGTEEAPGEVELYHGRAYKTYRGMGSVSAMAQPQGSSDRYFQEVTQSVEKLVPEGIEGRVPYKGKVLGVVHQLIGGLRAGMGYTGCETIADLHTRAQCIKVSPAGIRESHVHDVVITKEAPNYWRETN